MKTWMPLRAGRRERADCGPKRRAVARHVPTNLFTACSWWIRGPCWQLSVAERTPDYENNPDPSEGLWGGGVVTHHGGAFRVLAGELWHLLCERRGGREVLPASLGVSDLISEDFFYIALVPPTTPFRPG